MELYRIPITNINCSDEVKRKVIQSLKLSKTLENNCKDQTNHFTLIKKSNFVYRDLTTGSTEGGGEGNRNHQI